MTTAKPRTPFDRQFTVNPAHYWRALGMAAALCAAIHVAFAGLFLRWQLPWLAAANVLSVGIHLSAWALLRRPGLQHWGAMLIGTEITAHAMLATWVLGWEAGFQYYLILVLPPLMMSHKLRPAQKWRAGGLVLIGFLCLDQFTHHRLPTASVSSLGLGLLHSVNLLAALGLLAGMNAVYGRLVMSAEGDLRRLAGTDPLTGLLNRRQVAEMAARHWADAHAPAPCLLMGDIDHFKRINDQHGHPTGDLALQAVAQALQSGLRDGDLLGRWGGEEFLVLLRPADASAARMIAERLRALVQAVVLRAPDGQLIPVTMSFGLALVRPDETWERAVARADEALYQAKIEGRNRVVVVQT